MKQKNLIFEEIIRIKKLMLIESTIYGPISEFFGLFSDYLMAFRALHPSATVNDELVRLLRSESSVLTSKALNAGINVTNKEFIDVLDELLELAYRSTDESLMKEISEILLKNSTIKQQFITFINADKRLLSKLEQLVDTSYGVPDYTELNKFLNDAGLPDDVVNSIKKTINVSGRITTNEFSEISVYLDEMIGNLISDSELYSKQIKKALNNESIYREIIANSKDVENVRKLAQDIIRLSKDLPKSKSEKILEFVKKVFTDFSNKKGGISGTKLVIKSLSYLYGIWAIYSLFLSEELKKQLFNECLLKSGLVNGSITGGTEQLTNIEISNKKLTPQQYENALFDVQKRCSSTVTMEKMKIRAKNILAPAAGASTAIFETLFKIGEKIIESISGPDIGQSSIILVPAPTKDSTSTTNPETKPTKTTIPKPKTLSTPEPEPADLEDM